MQKFNRVRLINKIYHIYSNITIRNIHQIGEKKVDLETITLHLEGRALFYLEGTTKKVGVIPFEVTVVAKVRTQNGRIYGKF